MIMYLPLYQSSDSTNVSVVASPASLGTSSQQSIANNSLVLSTNNNGINFSK